ncbi:hypothetical protein U9M73_17705 [Paenibacillus phoenicis]|uniref:Uncharacterized protein n=1 Tax=Paenibacillus phoenicis TaxID=554117 RepID=A0ABU5PPB8_9BACL|nr:hypothetical protein [Paenibacillus phoenicis]MEA3571784.1 hypothetical protein [Paenibacillus phoenicis]
MKSAIIIPTVTLGYYRNCRTQLIEVTLGMGRTAKRAAVHPTLFIAVFPDVDRRWTGGTIDANPSQLYALGLGPKPRKEMTVKLADMPYQVRYVYAPQIDRYIARLLGTRQELSSGARHFRHVTGVSNRAVLGSISLTADQARALGFIIAQEEVAADELSA